ncbi:MAG: amidohydrolase family protein [Porticoccaceae bacterium]|nr:amidohydrolase family protein [Porticoccaceae bacterium]
MKHQNALTTQNKFIRLIPFLLILCLSNIAVASSSVAILAGHLIDPATGKIRDNQIILINDETIVEVGGKADIPAGAKVIDLSDAWVMPGLMNAHAHLALDVAHFKGKSTAYRALLGAYNASIVLKAGFTTIKDIGDSGNYAMADVRRGIDNGWFPGPTIFDAGDIIAPYGNGAPPGTLSPEAPRSRPGYIQADTVDEIRKAVRRTVFYGANTIKILSENPTYSEDEIRAAVNEAERLGVRVSVHVGGKGVTDVILGGAHSVEHGLFMTDKQRSLMKKHGVWLVPTLFSPEHLKVAKGSSDKRAEKVAEILFDTLQRAHQAGVKLAFGPDIIADLPDKDRAETALATLSIWTAAGIPPSDILRSMITEPAELLGIENERGAIKAGFKADIIATPNNPLENIDALGGVSFVMKEGAVIVAP